MRGFATWASANPTNKPGKKQKHPMPDQAALAAIRQVHQIIPRSKSGQALPYHRSHRK
jgi:hypothetical protein